MNEDLKQLAQLHDENIELKKEIERLKGELFGKSEQLKAENDYKKQIMELQSALATERQKNTAMAKGLIPKEYLNNYARIQIEKDRQKISEEFINQGVVGCSDIINEIPIILD